MMSFRLIHPQLDNTLDHKMHHPILCLCLLKIHPWEVRDVIHQNQGTIQAMAHPVILSHLQAQLLDVHILLLLQRHVHSP